jgi:hypothetical protein
MARGIQQTTTEPIGEKATDDWVTFPGGELEGKRPKAVCPACREAMNRGFVPTARTLCFQCYRAELDRARAARRGQPQHRLGRAFPGAAAVRAGESRPADRLESRACPGACRGQRGAWCIRRQAAPGADRRTSRAAADRRRAEGPPRRGSGPGAGVRRGGARRGVAAARGMAAVRPLAMTWRRRKGRSDR